LENPDLHLEEEEAAWQPDALQQAVLARKGLPESKCNEIILANRQQLYIPGDIEDIRLGDYLVEGGFCEGGQPYIRKFADFYEGDFNGNPCVWGRGLEQCISLDLAGLPAVVVDKHNLVLDFIWEAYLNGLIQKGSKLITFDKHNDMHERDRKSVV
jgi:hypothetical protein